MKTSFLFPLKLAEVEGRQTDRRRSILILSLYRIYATKYNINIIKTLVLFPLKIIGKWLDSQSFRNEAGLNVTPSGNYLDKSHDKTSTRDENVLLYETHMLLITEKGIIIDVFDGTFVYYYGDVK